MFEWKVGNGMERKFAIARIYLLALLLLCWLLAISKRREDERSERTNIKFTALALAYHPLEFLQQQQQINDRTDNSFNGILITIVWRVNIDRNDYDRQREIGKVRWRERKGEGSCWLTSVKRDRLLNKGRHSTKERIQISSIRESEGSNRNTKSFIGAS